MSTVSNGSKAASEVPSHSEVEEKLPESKEMEEGPVVTDLPVMHTAKRLKVEARKLDGMQRELYSLIGDNTPPVAISGGVKFKTRPEWQQKAASWKLVEFSPKDTLTLKHWIRATSVADGASDYRFSRFDTPSNVPRWSDSDYDLFKSEDWTLEETKYLFDLARDYDLRWLVIVDRYEFTKERRVEDLKERYYEVCTSLLKNKPMVGEVVGASPIEEELLLAMKFSKEDELKRKQHLERLYSRSPKEVAEEEALILEAKRLENMLEKVLAERKEFLRLLESPAPISAKVPKADVNSSHGVGQLLQELQNEKSRKLGLSSTTNSGSAGAVSNPRKTVSNIVSRTLNRKVTAREESAIGIVYSEAGKIKTPGVYLRSSRLTQIRQNILPKVKSVASELELSLKPVMPTARTCAKYEQLYQLITFLLEAKKVEDKLELEIDVLKRAKESVNEPGAVDNESVAEVAKAEILPPPS